MREDPHLRRLERIVDAKMLPTSGAEERERFGGAQAAKLQPLHSSASGSGWGLRTLGLLYAMAVTPLSC